MIEVAFVGSCVDEDELEFFPDASVAGNKYQNGLLKSFSNEAVHVHKIITPTYAAFPRRTKIIVSSSVVAKKKDRSICGYVNIPIIKQITTSVSLFSALMKWSKETKSSNKCVVMYNLFSYRDIALRLFCMIQKVPRILAIADVTEKGYGFWRNFEYNTEKKHVKDYDGLIPITDQIQKDYAPLLPFYRIEGGISDRVIQDSENLRANKKEHLIVYTGALNQYSSIEVLLDAFSMIDNQDYRLSIAGTGPLEELVKIKAREDSRVEYLGQISNKDAVQLQRKADILVCPRLPDDFVTKYTFPSKIMEYLSTGNVVVSFPLDGIPEEYFEYLYIPKGCSVNALKSTLESCSENDLNKRKAQIDFINSKMWEMHSEGIYDFICKVISKRIRGKKR